MIDEQRPYRTLVLPFGVIQLVQDIERLNPANDEFDPVRTFEYAASPIHYIAKRGSGTVGNAFIQVSMPSNSAAVAGIRATSGIRPAASAST